MACLSLKMRGYPQFSLNWIPTAPVKICCYSHIVINCTRISLYYEAPPLILKTLTLHHHLFSGLVTWCVNFIAVFSLQTKMDKSFPIFKPYSFKGVPPPPLSPGFEGTAKCHASVKSINKHKMS